MNVQVTQVQTFATVWRVSGSATKIIKMFLKNPSRKRKLIMDLFFSLLLSVIFWLSSIVGLLTSFVKDFSIELTIEISGVGFVSRDIVVREYD